MSAVFFFPCGIFAWSSTEGEEGSSRLGDLRKVEKCSGTDYRA